MPVKMTETAIQAAAKRAAETGARLDVSDAMLPGLRLRLTPAGARSWVLACRDPLGVQGGDKAGHRIVGAVLTRAVQNPSTV